jgi:hypothetical protein
MDSRLRGNDIAVLMNGCADERRANTNYYGVNPNHKKNIENK